MADTPHMFEQEVRVSRPVRMLLAAVLIFGVMFFGGVGIVFVVADNSAMPHPIGVLAVGCLFCGIAVAFGFIAWRLIRMRTSTNYLFDPRFGARAAKAAGPCIAATGLACIALSAFAASKEILFLGLFVAASGAWYSWKAWRA